MAGRPKDSRLSGSRAGPIGIGKRENIFGFSRSLLGVDEQLPVPGERLNFNYAIGGTVSRVVEPVCQFLILYCCCMKQCPLVQYTGVQRLSAPQAEFHACDLEVDILLPDFRCEAELTHVDFDSLYNLFGLDLFLPIQFKMLRVWPSRFVRYLAPRVSLW